MSITSCQNHLYFVCLFPVLSIRCLPIMAAWLMPTRLVKSKSMAIFLIGHRKCGEIQNRKAICRMQNQKMQSDLSGFFQLGYRLDNRSLYIAFTVTDDNFIEDTSQNVRWNTQDGLELSIDARHLLPVQALLLLCTARNCAIPIMPFMIHLQKMQPGISWKWPLRQRVLHDIMNGVSCWEMKW